jgi:hypothetical protein
LHRRKDWRPNSLIEAIHASHPIRQNIHKWIGFVTDDTQLPVISPQTAANFRTDLPHLSDHQWDALVPLLQLAELLGGDCPHRVRNALITVFRQSLLPENNDPVQLLADIRDAFADSDRLSTQELLDFLNTLPNRTWSTWNDGRPLNAQTLAALLLPFFIIPRLCRLEEKVLRGYLRQDFLEAWARSLPAQPSPKPNKDAPCNGAPPPPTPSPVPNRPSSIGNHQSLPSNSQCTIHNAQSQDPLRTHAKIHQQTRPLANA